MRISRLLLLLFPSFVLAQSVPNGTITPGQVWSAAQWNTAWQDKVDVTNGTLNSPTMVTPVLGVATASGLTLTNVTGSTQCLQANSSGVVSGTGAACGGSGGTPGGSNGQIQYNNSGVFGGLATTGTGNAVLATSPTLIAPVLGAATATTINGTAIPASTTIPSYTGTPTATHCANWSAAGVLADSGAACGGGGGSGTVNSGTSGQLAYYAATGTAVSGLATTGSGNAVLATSPTLVTPVLGTPTSVTLTNATGLPIATGVSGLGTGVATALAVNTGTAGSPVVNGGALGTPTSATLTNATGLPSGTGLSTTLTAFSSITGCSNSTVVGGTIPLGSAFFVGAGSFNAGSSGTCAVTINLPTAVHGWRCSGSDKTAAVIFVQNGSSASTCLITGAATSGDTIVFEVEGY